VTTDELAALLAAHPGLPVLLETETMLLPVQVAERDQFAEEEGPVVVLTPDFTAGG
jgi:hypothetical protein